MNRENPRSATSPIALALTIVLFFAAPAQGQELRLFLNDSCIVADEPIVVPDAVASKGLAFGGLIVSDAGRAVIRVLIVGVARGLAYFGARRDYSYSASEDMYLYNVDYGISPEARLNASLSCMTVVAGRFAPANADCVRDYEPLVLTDEAVVGSSLAELRRGRSSANVLRRANVCLDGEPDILIENRVKLSEDGSAFRLEGAGREINRLLSTDKANARRGLLLTASLFAPAPDGRGRHLSTHWINYGMIAPAGRTGEYGDTASSTWTPVPTMTGAVLANYNADSAAYREARSKAADLERSILRQSRQVSDLEKMLEGADRSSTSVIQSQIDQLKSRTLAQEVELDAWRNEYDMLPGGTYDYMPVTLRLTLTETRDEKRLLQVLAELLDANSRNIARAIADSDIWDR